MARGRPRQAAEQGTAAPTVRGRRANNRPQVPFAFKLVLNQWLLSLFDLKRFEDLAEPLRNEALEGLDENNVHRFHHALTAQLFNLTHLPTELLLEYDQNIVTHTLHLNERRITRGEDTSVWLHSFIVSNTPSHTMRMLWKMEKVEMQRRHIVFQEEDKESYISSILSAAASE